MEHQIISERAAALSRLHYGINTPLLALTILTVASRLYVRTYPKCILGWDDWCLLVGSVGSPQDSDNFPRSGG